MSDKISVKYRHYHLTSGNVLTTCTSYHKNSNILRIGWAIFNKNDGSWNRKYGNVLAYKRMNDCKYSICFSNTEILTYNYIEIRVLSYLIQLFNTHNHGISKNTIVCLLEEIYFNLLIFNKNINQHNGEKI